MRYIKFILLILFLAIASPVGASTLDISDAMDKSLVAGLSNEYSLPQEIVFVQIDGNFENMNISTREYVNTLYYYCITKLNLPFLPYHYIVNRSGEVYQVNSYDSLRILGEGKLVVGYLSNNPIVPQSTGTKILEFTSELSSMYGIQQYSVSSLELKRNENAFTQISTIDANSNFAQSVDKALEEFEPSDRENLSYKASIVDIEYEKSIEIGNRLDVKLTVKNENDFIWFSTKDPIYVSVKDSKESSYAVNQDWDSFSKPVSIDSSIYVMPGETVELTFQMDPKIAPGDAKESFVLLKFDDQEFENSAFDIEFKVEKGDRTLVEVSSEQYGYVNIRECRWYSCDVLTVGKDGEVYIVLSEEEGWYKIGYGDGQEGWINARYAKKL